MKIPITTVLKYRRDIDGLRAIAVLSVIGFHAFPAWIRGGFVGVDVFFVISGYLISTIIIDGLKQGSFNFIEFYVRRIKRIFPALLVVLISCYVFGWFSLFADEYRQLAKHIVGGAGFFSNFLLWKESGYFDNLADTKPLLHLWSLSIEEQFYIVWPVMLYAAWTLRLNLVWLFLLIFSVSLSLNLTKIGTDHIGTFYLPATRFWELGMGGGLSILHTYRRNQGASLTLVRSRLHIVLANSGSIFGAVLIGASLFYLNKNILFPGWWALLPTAGACLILAGGDTAWFNRKILSNRVLAWFGLISYPLYLWHWPLLAFNRIVEGGTSSALVRGLLVLTSIFLAWLTYELIEKPIRFGDRGNWKAGFLVALMLGIGVVAFGTNRLNGLAFRSIADSHNKVADLTNGGDISLYRKCPAVVSAQMPTLDVCVISKNEPPSMAVFGDSHAYRYYFGIAGLDTVRSWILLETNGGPPLSGVEIRNPDGVSLTRNSAGAVTYLSANSSIKTVVLAFFANTYLSLADGKLTSDQLESRNTNELFYAGLEKTVTLLEQSGKTVVIIIDNPELPFEPRNCIKRPFANLSGKHCFLDRESALIAQKELRNLLLKLQQDHSKLRVYDSFTSLCDSRVCNFESDYSIYYTDAHHLSQKGSTLVAGHFLKWLDGPASAAQ